MQLSSTKHETLVVVGSGPVGMISALLFKNDFKKVIVLERQSKEKFLEKNGFTFPIVFSPSAIKVLEHVGVWDAIMAEKSEYFGVAVHKCIMGKPFEFVTNKEDVYAHWRNHIIKVLYERMLAEGIEVIFQTKLVAIDFEGKCCYEAAMGRISFDLLLGADGIHSQTRSLMAEAHPEYTKDDFRLQPLGGWHAYRLPTTGKLRESLGGGEKHIAANIFLVDNLADDEAGKFRIVVSSMRKPDEEINILIRHGLEQDMQKVKSQNIKFFEQYIDSTDVLDAAWDVGISGTFEHVHAPTVYLNRVLLFGDAAHGFESHGDLINIGITSVGSFHNILKSSESIDVALYKYNSTIGESLRFYSSYALRRGLGKTTGEIASFGMAGKLGLVDKHPGIYGIFADDFEIQECVRSYKRDLRTIKMLSYSTMSILLSLISMALLPVVLVSSN